VAHVGWGGESRLAEVESLMSTAHCMIMQEEKALGNRKLKTNTEDAGVS
jgi:hypothetical protein